MPSPLDILQQYWHHNAFRPMQEEIIHAVLEGKDTLALLPTGGGKSVCFQVPAMLMEGLCIVISPLIALMKDQTANLEKKGIAAAALHSGLTPAEVIQVLDRAAEGAYKFLYVSPERLETALFKDYLPSLQVVLITVDEAHCISQWGYDFRPPYLRIAALRDELPGVPVLALTASATPRVQEDIADKLRMKTAVVFRQSFERPALSYSVFETDSKINKLLDVLSGVPGSALVYCSSRRQTKEVARLLNLRQVNADFYHAGLTQEERDRKQQDWLSQKTRVMVCTNAFGMGIDKANVRAVVHYDVPDCLENYYQEAGRAGRDGNKAYAVLLYQPQDITDLQLLPDIRYPAVSDIRRVYQALADYLHIPVGSGKGMYFDFDFNEFVTRFGLDVHLVMNAIRVLEQEGHLSFNENIFLPAQAGFTAGRQQLEQFEQSFPQLEPLIKCLLRTYEGIFNNRVSVFEKQMARLCRLPVETVVQQLQQLSAYGIIEYLPQKDTPQLHYLLPRAPAAHLHINHEQYLLRKKLYRERVETMLAYLALLSGCRSRFIAAYFGDAAVPDCGTCDNCLQRKAGSLTAAEFRQIERQIYAMVQEQTVDVKELVKQLQPFGQEKSWEVIRFLLAERKIRMSESGEIAVK